MPPDRRRLRHSRPSTMTCWPSTGAAWPKRSSQQTSCRTEPDATRIGCRVATSAALHPRFPSFPGRCLHRLHGLRQRLPRLGAVRHRHPGVAARRRDARRTSAARRRSPKPRTFSPISPTTSKYGRQAAATRTGAGEVRPLRRPDQVQGLRGMCRRLPRSGPAHDPTRSPMQATDARRSTAPRATWHFFRRCPRRLRRTRSRQPSSPTSCWASTRSATSVAQVPVPAVERQPPSA